MDNSPQAEDKSAMNPPELVEKILKERVFIMASAATLMTQTDEAGVPLVLRPDMHRRQLWIDTLPQMPKPEDEGRVYPYRNGGFGMSPDLMVGTIDQLVELFREKLTLSCRTMVSSTARGSFVDPSWSARVGEVYACVYPDPGLCSDPSSEAVKGKGYAVPMLDELHPKVLEVREKQSELARKLLATAAKEREEALAENQSK